jgi:hypothetical protein
VTGRTNQQEAGTFVREEDREFVVCLETGIQHDHGWNRETVSRGSEGRTTLADFLAALSANLPDFLRSIRTGGNLRGFAFLEVGSFDVVVNTNFPNWKLPARTNLAGVSRRNRDDMLWVQGHLKHDSVVVVPLNPREGSSVKTATALLVGVLIALLAVHGEGDTDGVESPPVMVAGHILENPLVENEVTIGKDGDVILGDELNEGSSGDLSRISKSLLPEVLDGFDAEARTDECNDLVRENLRQGITVVKDNPIFEVKATTKVTYDSLRFDDRKKDVEFSAFDDIRGGLETFNVRRLNGGGFVHFPIVVDDGNGAWCDNVVYVCHGSLI